MAATYHSARADRGAGPRRHSFRSRTIGIRRSCLVIALSGAIAATAGCPRAQAPVPAQVVVTESPMTAAPLLTTELERVARGRRIYQTGESPSGGKISALVGDGAEVPAKLLACSNCHGRDGRGGSEGALTPSDVRWTSLTKPYEYVRSYGRRRPPYTEPLITRAIAMSVDSGGAPLDQAMPRYRLSLDDNADLIAYLKVLERDHDPGVTDGLVRIGVLLPPKDEARGQSEAVREVLHAQVKALNERGGLYHRQIVLTFAETPHETNQGVEVVRKLISGSEPVFALLAPNLSGVDSRVLTIAEQEGVPLLGVIAPPAPERPSPCRWCYFLLAGPDDQAFALTRLTLQDGRAGGSLAIVHGSEATQRELGRTLRDRCQHADLARPINLVEVSDARDDLNSVVRALKAVEVIILLGPAGRTVEILASLADSGKVPTVLVPSSLSDGNILDLPVKFDRRVLLALPIAPSDQNREGLARYLNLAGSRGPSEHHRTAQIGALAAAEVLAEGLRRAERGLTREQFVAGLDRLRDFRTGLAPPLTLSPNRRVGAPGAHAVTVDLIGRRLIPDGPWIDADGALPSR
jgi:ABC-type branched-subunit amino acid transport system substrate-binding protein/mono/diheme cytochrome c family protein